MTLNLNAAAAGLPLGGDFERLEESERQTVLRRLVERLVEQLEQQGRDPDPFEREHLGAAIICLKHGYLAPVPAQAALACTPTAERVPVASGGLLEVPDNLTLRELLDRAEG